MQKCSFFYYVGGGKMFKVFRKTIKLKKNLNGQFSFFDILQLPHTEISNSEKLTHPNAPLHMCTE